MKQDKQKEKDAKALENARIISSLCKYATDNNWLHVNDYPATHKIEHMVYISPNGVVVAIGIDANDEVLVWNKTP